MDQKLLKRLELWANQASDIEALIVVGSYAKGTNRADSDLDLVIVTTKKQSYLKDMSFITNFGKVNEYQVEYYGACTSVRVWYNEGIEVEFGLVDPSWLTKPLDIGTRNVLQAGYLVIVDKRDGFQAMRL